MKLFLFHFNVDRPLIGILEGLINIKRFKTITGRAELVAISLAVDGGSGPKGERREGEVEEVYFHVVVAHFG